MLQGSYHEDLTNPDLARELASLLARASIGRIAPGHYFRGGQLLVGFLRTFEQSSES
jgi:hypothetical protein